MADSDGARPISLFYSYSHKDESLRSKLKEHLAPLRHSGLIKEWHDRNINAGEEWAKEIDQHLETADIILLLISSAFIASRYCYSIEMKRALERHDRGEAKVIPVILRECHWKIAPFAKLQAVPENGKAVKSWSNQDKALTNIAENVERVANKLRAGAVSASPVAVPPPAGSPGRPLTPDPNPPAGGGIAAANEVGKPRQNRVRVMRLEVFRDLDAPWCPEMVMLPAGEFLMGSPAGEEGRDGNEGPQHWVTISHRFALGQYAVTFAEYDYFCAATKRYKPADEGWGRGRRPVIDISWYDAVAYCAWLSQETGQSYCLPTEAEWEYACRAGTTSRYSWGDAITPKHANYSDSKLGKTMEVGAYPASPWVLYDMHGNVWEWCADGRRTYTPEAMTDPVGPGGGPDGDNRILRGGSWNNFAVYARCANRYAFHPSHRRGYFGFRCARV